MTSSATAATASRVVRGTTPISAHRRSSNARSLSEYSTWPRPWQIFPQARRSRRSWVRPNEEATTTAEEKSARSRRVGPAKGVCGVARLVRSRGYGLRRAPSIRSFAGPTRLTWNTETGSLFTRRRVPRHAQQGFHAGRNLGGRGHHGRGHLIGRALYRR